MNEVENAVARAQAAEAASRASMSPNRARLWAGLNRYLAAESEHQHKAAKAEREAAEAAGVRGVRAGRDRRDRRVPVTTFKIRIHGRGGQGAVTAAEMLSVAAFGEGWHAQAFPTFGSERTGAPVVSFCRLDDRPIRIHEPIAEPDAVLIQDPTLLHQVKVFEGIRPDTYVLVNTGRSFTDLGMQDLVAGLDPARVMTVPATAIAREHVGRPMPNTALLGGFAALTGKVTIDGVAEAIRQRFAGPVGEANVAAARAAFAHVAEARGHADA